MSKVKQYPGFSPEALDRANQLASLSFLKEVHLFPNDGLALRSDGLVMSEWVSTLGRGTLAVRLSLKKSDLPVVISKVRGILESAMPQGCTPGSRRDFGLWKKVPPSVKNTWARLALDWDELPFKINNLEERFGTLGVGRNCIKLAEGPEGYVWIVIHSDSRGIAELGEEHFRKEFIADLNSYRIQPKSPQYAYAPVSSKHGREFLHFCEKVSLWGKASRRALSDIVVEVLKQSPHIVPFSRQDLTFVDTSCSSISVDGEELVYREGCVNTEGCPSFLFSGDVVSDTSLCQPHSSDKRLNSSPCITPKLKLEALSEEEEMSSFLKLTAHVSCSTGKLLLSESPRFYKQSNIVLRDSSDFCTELFPLKTLVSVFGA